VAQSATDLGSRRPTPVPGASDEGHEVAARSPGALIRGQVLSLRETQFVEAAHSLGASTSWIMLREILPNLVAPLLVYATLAVPENILFEAALSFLGVGKQEPTPAWGTMLERATDYAANGEAWWYMFWPGVALFVTVLAFNLLGYGLRDALDPRTGR
jgi:peptide/nickel transport system permease protein